MNIETPVLVYAIRYALGRQSGAVLDVINSTMNNIDIIEEKYKGVILKDILQFLSEDNEIIKNYMPEDIILSWKGLAVEIFKRSTKETKEWLVNSLGGGISEQMMKKVFDLGVCPYCGKAILEPFIDTVWENRHEKKVSFCSHECAYYFQMGAES